ncbi:WSC domain-containing protein [Bipolaris maydis]|nr:WSC domain-containing protein [Bipolaris maydis]
MRTSLALLFTALAQRAVSTRSPLLQWDPDTVKDCVEWYNNGEGKTCEYVRKLVGITAAEFYEWNPSVGPDCSSWRRQSYCVMTQTKLDAWEPTTTFSTVTTTTTKSTSSSLAPSPTAWDALGCYTQNPTHPLLQLNTNANGDASLTIPKCKNSCYRRAFKFAGVQEGNQCLCGSYVNGEWTKNQTDCNAPCTGNKADMCGGKGLVNVFEALENTAPATTTAKSASVTNTATKSASVTNTVTKSASIQAATASNGAIKNRALFGMGF